MARSAPDYARSLWIDLKSRKETEIFKWFLAIRGGEENQNCRLKRRSPARSELVAFSAGHLHVLAADPYICSAPQVT